jgi:transcriptional regulator with XRE-family HTH domain
MYVYAELFRADRRRDAEGTKIMSFGKKIKELRTSAGLTLDQLAQATGSSKSYIWELENKNPPRPSADKLSAIATALGVTVDYLLGTDDQTLEAAKDKAFFRHYSSLPEPTRRTIREMAELLSKKPDDK